MADYQYITETGVIVPDTSVTLEEVRAEFRNAFGADLDTSAETPQGVLITGEAVARDAVIRNNAAVANQINPNIAGGVFLDAIWALMGGGRVKATPSIVRDVTLTGVPGTVINEGVLASVGAAGAQFTLTGGVILDGSGNGTGTFQSVDFGPIVASTGALNQIVTGVLGWETISNPSPAELGVAEESDIASRIRRRQTLALQGVALPEAIISGQNTVTGVRSLSFRENVTGSPITIEGVTLSPHSIYACVDGGSDTDVALMLLRKKSFGADWNGTTTVTVTDPYSGQDYPVQFDRPELVPIFVQVTIRNASTYADPPTIVRNAILAYANGEQEGESGFVVGGDVSAFELASAVNRDAAPIYVQSLLISDDNTTFSASNITITIAQKATILAGNIAVTVLP